MKLFKMVSHFNFIDSGREWMKKNDSILLGRSPKNSHRVNSYKGKITKLEKVSESAASYLMRFFIHSNKNIRRIKIPHRNFRYQKKDVIFVHLCLLIYSLLGASFFLSKINHKNYSNVKIFFHLVRKISLINTFHFILLMPYFARCAHEMLIKIFMLYCFMQMLNEKKGKIKATLKLT